VVPTWQSGEWISLVAPNSQWPNTGESPVLDLNEGLEVIVKGIPFIGVRCFDVPEGRCLFFVGWLLG
jgi:hypothetical protein